MKKQQKKLADVSKKAVANSNAAALRKNEVHELKKKLSKFEARLEAKKKEQEPVFEAMISERDEKIKSITKENKDALAMKRSEIDRWKETNREMVGFMHQKENMLKYYQKRLTNLSKTNEEHDKRISALEAKHGELKGQLSSLKKRTVSNLEEAMAMEEWKSNNRVREHTAKLMANNEHDNQRNKISAKNRAETLQQYAPFLNSMVSGGGQRNGTLDPSGFVLIKPSPT